jgi:flavodoxin
MPGGIRAVKALVVYDTVYGNTEKIAEAIGTGLEDCAEVKVYKVNEVDPKYWRIQPGD